MPSCELSNKSFLCKSGVECVPLDKVCNSKADCADKSDEGGLCGESDACKSTNCNGADCVILPTGPTCVCQKGYSFNNVTSNCEVSYFRQS